MTQITPEFLKTLTDTLVSTSRANNHSITQQIAVQSFNGSDQYSVYAFLEKFEENTKDLTDSQRASAVPRFLTGSAKTWYNIEARIKPETSWEKLKKKLTNRFGGKSAKEYHIEKLRSIQFDPSSKSVSDYIEKFIEHYQKAYPKADEAHLVAEIHRSLPKQTQADINKFKTIPDGTTLQDYRETIQDYDDHVHKLTASTPVCAAQNSEEVARALSESLKPMIEDIINKKLEAGEEAEEEAPVAAIGNYISNRRRNSIQKGFRRGGPQHHVYPGQQNQFQFNHPHQPGFIQQNPRFQTSRYQQATRQQQQPFRTQERLQPSVINEQTGVESQSQPVDEHSGQMVLSNNNYRGMQTTNAGCFNCNGNHFARDCPMRTSFNINQRGRGCFNCGGSHFARNCPLNAQGRPW